MECTRGIIEGFGGSWGSGIGVLYISGIPVNCENAQTVRSLDACFGNVITSGHGVNQNAIIGKDIVYTTDRLGMLEGFTPYEDWEGGSIEVGQTITFGDDEEENDEN
jgi:hypothetical protein